MDNFPIWADHLLAILVGVIIPASSASRNHRSGGIPADLNTDQKKSFYLSASLSLFIMAFIVMAVWLIFGRTLIDIGLRQPNDNNLQWWLTLLFIVIYAADTVYTLSSRSHREKALEHLNKKTPFLPAVRSELPLYLVMCLSAGVFEEMVFRGFLVTYCYYLFSGISYQWLWAIILPTVIFSVAHYYQGAKAVIKSLVLSFLFGYIFLVSGSLLIVMFLHFLVNVTGGLVAMWLTKMNRQ